MPLEISEVGVRLMVGGDGSSGGVGHAGGAVSSDRDGAGDLPPDVMDRIVDRCARRVLDALRRQETR